MLEYPGPAAEWLHALPLGNGHLGAMCWGGSSARFDLNHEGLWSGSPAGDATSAGGTDREARQLLARARAAAASEHGHEATEPLQALQAPYAQAFLPLGTLEVRTADAGPGRRSLDLRTGTHTWSWPGGRSRTVVSAVDDVLLHVVDGASSHPVEVRLTSPLHELHREQDTTGIELWLRAPSDVAPGHEPDLPAATWGPGAVEACVVVGWREHGDRWVLAVAVETTYDGPGSALRGPATELAGRARARVERVLAQDPDELLRRPVGDDHVRDVVWPVLRDAAEFALSWLVRTPDGSWGTVPSTSPENTFVDAHGRTVAVAWSSAMDRALVRDALRSVVELAPRVGPDATDLAGRAGAVLPDLPGIRVATDGRVQEWGAEQVESDPHHRHVSHLYPLFPGDEALTAAEEAAMVASLDGRGDDSSGWSLAWKIALWARLHRPDHVSDLLDLVFRDATGVHGQWAGGLYRNLFAAHPPFQIDGNLGYAAALAECLVQSHRGYVELLPALPAELASGSAHGLVARPGVVVDLDWADGDLVQATVRPRSPAPEAVEGRTVVLRWRGREVRRRLADAPVVVGPADFRGAGPDEAGSPADSPG
ncbi:glycosyl hydrolase family 95 catalytic domain-containing protein [Promicromonospora aerolata]|uniref:Glycoside hydrolase N-terminal domain-containing protein n=1 Tax=Promicromonospora aerolata TaxID=195749 RepID=A0ABW4VH31_9MICO